MLVRCMACPADGFCRRCEEQSSPAAAAAFQDRLFDAGTAPEFRCPACSGPTTNHRSNTGETCNHCLSLGYHAEALF